MAFDFAQAEWRQGEISPVGQNHAPRPSRRMATPMRVAAPLLVHVKREGHDHCHVSPSGPSAARSSGRLNGLKPSSPSPCSDAPSPSGPTRSQSSSAPARRPSSHTPSAHPAFADAQTSARRCTPRQRPCRLNGLMERGSLRQMARSICSDSLWLRSVGRGSGTRIRQLRCVRPCRHDTSVMCS